MHLQSTIQRDGSLVCAKRSSAEWALRSRTLDSAASCSQFNVDLLNTTLSNVNVRQTLVASEEVKMITNNG